MTIRSLGTGTRIFEIQDGEDVEILRRPGPDIKDFFSGYPLHFNLVKSLSLSLNWTRLDSNQIWFQNF